MPRDASLPDNGCHFFRLQKFPNLLPHKFEITSRGHELNFSMYISNVNVGIYDTCDVGIYDTCDVGIYDTCDVGIYDTCDVGIYDTCDVGIYDTCDVGIHDTCNKIYGTTA